MKAKTRFPARLLAICLLLSAEIISPTQRPIISAVAAELKEQRSNSIPDFQALIAEAKRLAAEGKHGDAAAIWRQILTSQQNALGPDHLDVADSLDYLAGLLSKQGQYIAAESLYRRSLAILEKALGPDHPDVAISLNNLATLLGDQGHYAAAELLQRRSIAITEKIVGTNHPDIAGGLNNLAAILHYQGDYHAAESVYRRSLTIWEKALGPDHPKIAVALSNMAVLLREQGKNSAAEKLFRRSLTIREKALGPNHPDVAASLSNLSILLIDQGQYGAAELYLRRSLHILEDAFGTDHPDIALDLNSLASILKDQGKLAEAEALFRRSLGISEKAMGSNHPDVATILNSLAYLLIDRDQYGAAETLLRRSLSIREKAFGTSHPYFAISLNNLAFTLRHQEKFPEAEVLYRKSLATLEKVYGPDHLNVATNFSNLALLLSDQQKHLPSMAALSRSLTIQLNWLIRELPLLPDQGRSAQLRQLGYAWQYPFDWIDRYPPTVRLAVETRINWQGLLPEIEKRQAQLLSTTGSVKRNVEQLQAITNQLASIATPAEGRSAAREQRDRLQAELYRQISELQIQPVSIAAVAQALPRDGVLVEFQRYRRWKVLKPKDHGWDEPRYIALVLKPDASISAIQLGPAAPIDALVHKVLGSSAQDQSDAEENLALLSNQVLKPLLPQLKGSRQWFLSPDGELNRVPFAALPAPQQPTIPLAQAVQLRLLTTGRELVQLQQPSAPGRQALVIANPRFDRPSAQSALSPITDASTDNARRRSSELGSSQWTPLPGSEREGQQVASLLGTSLISGPAATTTALQRQQGPRVLHIATHGFFVANQDSPPTDPLRAVQELTKQLQALRQEDPQLRSGLVFAGANQPDSDPNDDGYLTAAEAVTLNLKGTELVVLSACSTGQGEVRTGEGVYGLQRSLTVAGARSTLLSLWKVDDAATAAFMERFYKRLKAGEGRSEALAAVQQEFRDGSAGNGQWKEPYYWAAWQLVGDWRPIQGL